MDNVQIEIQDSTNGILGVLEVGSVKNFEMALNSSISDIKDIKSRSGSYAVTFKVPSTKNNDDLLGHIYISDQKNYKDFDAEKDCRIRINGIDIDSGVIQITRIASGGRAKSISYALKFFGNNLGWVLKMRGYKTNDLPYLDQTLTYDDTAVQASWSNVGGTEDPVYSIINRGARLDPATVNVGDLRPDYFCLDYLNSAFELIGYNFESTHFNATAQKDLMIPFFGTHWKMSQDTIDDNLVDVNITASNLNFRLLIPNTASSFLCNMQVPAINNCTVAAIVPPNNYYTCSSQSTTGTYTEVTDPANNFASGVFTAPFDGFYKVAGFFEGTYFYDPTTPEEIAGDVDRWLYFNFVQNGSIVHNIVGASTTVTSGAANPQPVIENTSGETNNIFMTAGDTLELYINYAMQNNGASSTGTLKAHATTSPNTSFTVTLQEGIEEGDTFNWQDKSDDQVDVFDIVMDIFRLFNCYIRTNLATQTVYVEPRDDFYNALSTATNKTDLIDNGTQFVLEYNSQSYKRNFQFSYATDSKDTFLSKRNEASDTDWCSYKYVYPDKFNEGTTPYNTNIIPATYTMLDENMTGTPVGSNGSSHGMFTARLWNEFDVMPDHSDDFAPRLLYFNYTTQSNGIASLYLNYRGSNTTSIPFALPFSIVAGTSGSALVASNLSFKDVDSPSPALADGLWQTYFSKTVQEIEEGKRLSLNLIFTLADWVDFDFRDIIYFDNRYAEIEGYWRVEKLKNYKPTSTAISTSFDLIQARTYVDISTDTFEDGLDSSSKVYNLLPNGDGRSQSRVGGGNKQTIITGYDNLVEDNNNIVNGNNLVANGQGQVIIGQYNVDNSTDTFNIGTGSPLKRNSLIRIDELGKIIFNGEEIKPNGNGSVVDISSDTTASLGVDTYLCNTEFNNVTLTLPSDANQGKSWNVKKIHPNHKMTIDTDGSELIDGVSNISETLDNISRKPQFDGTNFNLI